MNPFFQRLRRAAAFPFVVLLAVLLWLEDWLWEPLAELMRRIDALPLLRQLEALLRRAPPWLALACYAVPVLSLLPFKLVGLYLLGKGHIVLGGGVFVLAKLVGTALCARIFALTRDTLMRLAWFAWLWQKFVALREAVYARVTSHPVWRMMRRYRLALKRRVRCWRRRFAKQQA